MSEMRKLNPKELLARYHREFPADQARERRLAAARAQRDNPPPRSGQAEDVGAGERQGQER